MKNFFVLCLAVVVMATSCSKEESQRLDSHPSADDLSLTLESVAKILSELPLEKGNLQEVFDAVSSSSESGYDEEYMMSDLFSNPGSGVGGKQAATKAASYGVPLKDLFQDYFEQRCTTKAGSAEDALAYIEALSESEMQIYWPYSEDWKGDFPIITFDPGYGSETNWGYEIIIGPSGERTVKEVLVNESVASSRTVWVINNNDDSAYTPLDLYETKTNSSSDEKRKKLMLRRFMMLRNYDSWFSGGSEFHVLCGSASGFKATSLDDLQLYTPSVTDFMVVVRRRDLKKDLEIGTIIVTDFTDAIDKMAFLIIEDDGGTTTSWKCSATVKFKSKSYGFDMEIPYNDKDDIVWRGQLSGEYFTEGEEVTGRFGDIIVTFALE